MATVKLLAITPDAEHLIETTGRTCYLSNDKATDDSHKKFIRMIIKNGHHSVLEHAYATFRITGGSRSFTHQIVRHRLCAFSQQSQRYVNERDFSFVTPESVKKDSKALELFEHSMNSARDTYKTLVEMGIKKEDARFVLPNAAESEIVISANFRELRHIFNERYTPSAQWEIREIVKEMILIMKKEAPTVFEGYQV